MIYLFYLTPLINQRHHLLQQARNDPDQFRLATICHCQYGCAAEYSWWTNFWSLEKGATVIRFIRIGSIHREEDLWFV